MTQRINYGAQGEEVRAESLVSECHPTVLSQQHYSLSYSPHRHHLANQCLCSDGNCTSSISNFSIPSVPCSQHGAQGGTHSCLQQG